jgi:hypothetical protein
VVVEAADADADADAVVDAVMCRLLNYPIFFFVIQ